MEYLLLIIGFVLLIKGAVFFCGGKFFTCQVSQDSQRHHRSYDRCHGNQSPPEASVSINAALAGNNDIAVSNIIGSNILMDLLL